MKFKSLTHGILLGTICGAAVGLPAFAGSTADPIQGEKAKVAAGYQALEGQANMALALGEPRRARALLERVPIERRNTENYLVLSAACLGHEGRYEQAAEAFSVFKDLSAYEPHILLIAARAFAESGEYAKAIPLCNLEIKKSGDFSGYEVRSRCYAALGRNEEAARDMEKSAQLVPQRANDYYCKAARSYLLANKPDEALKAVAKAPPVKRGDGLVNPYLTRALCLEKLNRQEDALSQLSQAMSILRTNKTIPVNIAQILMTTCLTERSKCYEKLGKTAEAKADRKLLESISRRLEDDIYGK